MVTIEDKYDSLLSTYVTGDTEVELEMTIFEYLDAIYTIVNALDYETDGTGGSLSGLTTTQANQLEAIYNALATVPTYENERFTLPLHIESTSVASIDLSCIPNFQGLTVDDIYVCFPKYITFNGSSTAYNDTLSYSYNATSGLLTMTMIRDDTGAAESYFLTATDNYYFADVFIKPEVYKTTISLTGSYYGDIDVTSIEGYESLSLCNFYLSFSNLRRTSSGALSYRTIYDSSTGTLSLGVMSSGISNTLSTVYVIVDRFE